MLQPGMCSASRSESRTWIGPPGAFATHSAIAAVAGRRDVRAADRRRGRRSRSAAARYVQPVRVRDTRRRRCRRRSRRSPPRSPVLRACARPRFSVLISAHAVTRARSRRCRRSSRRRRRSPRSRDSRARCTPSRQSRIVRRAVVACRRRPRSGGQAARRARTARRRTRSPTAASAGFGCALAVDRGRSPSRRSRSRRGATRRSRRRRTRPRSRPRTPCGPASRSDARLRVLAVAAAVEPDLGHQQRAVAGEVLQPRRGRPRGRSRCLEEDVEADEVEERQLAGTRSSGS